MKKKTITNIIENNFKEYAIYTLENRGIPSFYDSLTNVQRLILLNTPLKSTKTLSVVGECIKSGYHHGDSSCSGAINKLARPVGCSFNILEGDGFFGSPLNFVAAQPRYTSVKLSSYTNQIIQELKFLNTKDDEGNYNSLNVYFPLGLLTSILGIAVGYQTKILPRKKEEIEKFLNDKKANLSPYFKNFKGKISVYNKLTNSWLIEGEIILDEENKNIQIKSIPPLMQYKSFIRKLDKLLYEEDVIVETKSQDNVDINIKIRNTEDWNELKERIIKYTKLIVKENIIFIKDGKVLEYECIEDYLTDFKIKNKLLNYEKMNYILNEDNKTLEFLKYKKTFFEFMMEKKRSSKEVENFILKTPIHIQGKLDNIKLRNLNKDELKHIIDRIDFYIDSIKKSKEEVEKYFVYLQNLDKQMHNKKDHTLFDQEIEEIDQIEVFSLQENGELEENENKE